MADMNQFTAAEAAFMLREPIHNVKKALDMGPVRPVLQLRSGAFVRVIDWLDLLYLFAVRALREDLTPRARGQFHEALRRARPERGGPRSGDPRSGDLGSGDPRFGDEVRFGRFRVAIADVVDEVKQRTADLAELRDKVTLADDGTAVLASRGVEVHRIAALLNGGLSVNAVLEEYPFLSRAAIETARAYAQASPRPGRPYPRTTANRAMRDPDFGRPDEVPDDADDGG